MAAQARWDAFLAQIEARHTQVLADAEASARAQLPAFAVAGDPATLSNQLAPIAARLHELESTIIDTWHQKVSAAFDAEGLTAADNEVAYEKGDLLRYRLEGNRDQLEHRIFAELARLRHARMPPVACTKCRGPIAVPLVFGEVELACTCGARQPFHPDSQLLQIAALAMHAIPQEAVVREWHAMRDADRAHRKVRPPKPLALIQAYEAAQIAYWRAYIAVRGRIEPVLARDPVLEVKKRMDQWYEWVVEHEEAWRAAGRPRMV
jgi:hypothetical protein